MSTQKTPFTVTKWGVNRTQSSTTQIQVFKRSFLVAVLNIKHIPLCLLFSLIKLISKYKTYTVVPATPVHQNEPNVYTYSHQEEIC